MRGETSTGFKFELDEARFDDMEFVTALSKAGKGDVFALPDMLEKLLGEKQLEALYDHVRAEDGRVPVTKVSEEIADIFAKVGESQKN